MENPRCVLCAIDVGSAAEAPLREADRIARRLDARLVVLHVVPDGYPGVPMSPAGVEDTLLEQQELSHDIGEHLVDLIVRLLGRSVDDFQVEVEAGVPHDVIVDRARELDALLVVLPSNGDTAPGQGMLGNVATHVARHAPCSVLVTRPRRVGGHVLAATDFSEPATRALMAAYEEARDRHAPLLVLHSLDVGAPEMVIGDPGIAPAVTIPGELARDARPAAQARLTQLLAAVPAPGETLVVEEPPATAIADTAARLGADLVVVGSSQRTRLGRLVLGSVADAVIREASCSVLIARPSLAHAPSVPAGG